MLQGATLQLGEGKVAIFGEASMFSAQLSATPPEPSWEQGIRLYDFSIPANNSSQNL